MKNTYSVFAAFIGGAIVGGAIALLLAPESGKETRKKVADFLGKNGFDIDNDLFDAENETTTKSKQCER